MAGRKKKREEDKVIRITFTMPREWQKVIPIPEKKSTKAVRDILRTYAIAMYGESIESTIGAKDKRESTVEAQEEE